MFGFFSKMSDYDLALLEFIKDFAKLYCNKEKADIIALFDKDKEIEYQSSIGGFSGIHNRYKFNFSFHTLENTSSASSFTITINLFLDHLGVILTINNPETNTWCVSSKKTMSGKIGKSANKFRDHLVKKYNCKDLSEFMS